MWMWVGMGMGVSLLHLLLLLLLLLLQLLMLLLLLGIWGRAGGFFMARRVMMRNAMLWGIVSNPLDRFCGNLDVASTHL